MKYSYVYVFFLVFSFMSCDPSGKLRLISGYEHEVTVHSFYEFNNSIINSVDGYEPGIVYSKDSRGAIEYSHVIAIRIEAMDGTVLAEYPPEYLERLRKLRVNQKYKHEAWIFTEKGLFLSLDEISRRYRTLEEVLAYYRSDEAVQDLQAMLEAVE
ncbi:MAG: hypothetical protein LBQ93_08890 [Treponema sp.]|jgi:hypothetical protein|nr:hypothetical protein [Treponema sp.]